MSPVGGCLWPLLSASQRADAGIKTRSSASRSSRRWTDVEETKPGRCERCGVYALLADGYPYCATCLGIIAEGKHYLFTVRG